MEDGTRYWSFSRYVEGDSNAGPTGGTVSLVYSLAEGAWAAEDTTELSPE